MTTDRLREAGAGVLRLAATAIVLWGFLLPWIVVDTNAFSEAVLGLPAGGGIPGWRLPSYAHEVETAWVVEIVKLFDDDQPHAMRVWLVWISPLSAVLALVSLWRRRFIGLLLTALLQGTLTSFLVARFVDGLSHHGNLALELGFGAGFGAAIVGHGLLFVLTLGHLTGKHRSKRSRRR